MHNQTARAITAEKESQNSFLQIRGSDTEGKTETKNEQYHFWYLSKKTEKLMTAVYMLTDFLSDSEPMKFRLRERALAILSDMHSLDRLVLSERKNAARKILDGIESVLSFLEIASSVGLISAMNVSVLKDEFSGLEEIIHGHIFAPKKESILFPPNFFALPDPNADNEIGNGSGENEERKIWGPMGTGS